MVSQIENNLFLMAILLFKKSSPEDIFIDIRERGREREKEREKGREREKH